MKVKRNDGRMILTTGKSRSGKTTVTFQSVANEPRLLVWDFQRRDWPAANCELIDGLPALTARLREVKDGPLRVSFRGEALNSQSFGLFSQCALAWLHHAPAVIVAEELADVVPAQKAPAGWGELVRTGLGYGGTIYGLTQRVQETDKSIFGNATHLRIFQTANSSDARYIAQATGIEVDDIDALKRLEYLEKNIESGAVNSFKLVF